MTPYHLAVDLFRRGSSHDDVVAQLVATGVDPADAQVATAAAAPQPIVVPPPAAPPPPPVRVARPAMNAAPADAVVAGPSDHTAAEAIAPGFHGWLLLATIVHSVYAVVTLSSLAIAAVAFPWLARRLDAEGLGLSVFWLVLFALCAVVLVTAMTLLFKRRRSARSWLIAWSLICFAIQLATFIFRDGSFTSAAIPFAWYLYFSRSKQLRATLTG